jgi:phosphatidylcholine synthase
MPLLVFLTFSPPVWLTSVTIVVLAIAQFTWLKFVHPVRTERWRMATLPVTLLWVILGGWSVWAEFEPPLPVKLGLLATSLWLLFVGILMQALPVRRPVIAE